MSNIQYADEYTSSSVSGYDGVDSNLEQSALVEMVHLNTSDNEGAHHIDALVEDFKLAHKGSDNAFQFDFTTASNQHSFWPTAADDEEPIIH